MLKKMILVFIKKILEKKIFIKSPYYERKKKEKRTYPPPFSNHPIPHHQRNKSLKNKKNPTFLP